MVELVPMALVITLSPLSIIPAVLVLHAPRPRLTGLALTRCGREHMPAWVRSLTTVTPTRAAVTGAVLTVVNPKVLFICAAAGLAIGTDALGVAGTVLSAALFVAVAASSVAVPILAYVAAGERADPPLERLKTWMEKHNAALVAAILVLIGLVVLYKGIRHL
ncbi:MAG: hypothetical protein QOH91_897 [Mycobacterium sp.]|jgi:threonine/homoserine/homoserine lactone efflux protein|nr:hypothetical protein [Mycobacterium sp.]